jgi:hypothetical protein
MSKRIVALPVALIALAVFVPGIANAANSVSISLSPGGNAFQGKVTPGSCAANRTVKLLKSTGGAFNPVGSDKTDSGGNWKVNTTPAINAKYKGQVVKKNASCPQADSKTLTARQTKSSISIGSTGNSFKGKITSVTNCVNGRTVKLQRSTGGGFVNIGSPDTSSSNGSWEVATNPVNNAQYRGNVAAKTVGTDACLAANSTVTTARNSVVSIQQGGSTNFHGTVTSVAACESNRTVTLQRKTIYETTFHNIGSDGTSPSGVWQVNTTVVSGASYRSSVAVRQAGANSCLDDLSNVIVAS